MTTDVDIRSVHLEAVIRLLREIEDTNGEVMDHVAALFYEAIRADRLIHVAGTGHSLIFVLEAFFRAGGLACINPIWHPALLPLSGGAISGLTERMSGLAEELIRASALASGDVLVVYSNSGINAVPVELAQAGRARGASVVAVVSGRYREVASRHPAGLRLTDVADVVIDTRVPVGDASFRAPGAPEATAPVSTYAGTYVWNSVLVRVAALAAADGVALPIWHSFNAPGAAEGLGDSLMAHYSDRVRTL